MKIDIILGSGEKLPALAAVQDQTLFDSLIISLGKGRPLDDGKCTELCSFVQISILVLSQLRTTSLHIDTLWLIFMPFASSLFLLPKVF